MSWPKSSTPLLDELLLVTFTSKRAKTSQSVVKVYQSDWNLNVLWLKANENVWNHIEMLALSYSGIKNWSEIPAG
jgi:hypothetical protein